MKSSNRSKGQNEHSENQDSNLEFRGTSQHQTQLSRSTSDKLTYLLVGGGIGALVALLFAPKSGTEIRSDIADATRKGVDRTREAATQIGQVSGDYLNTAKQKAGDIYTRAGGALNAAKGEFGKKSGAENETTTPNLPAGDFGSRMNADLNRDESDVIPVA